MKKILATLIMVVLLLSACMIAAFPTSAEDINWDDWIFDGQGKLVGYYGSESDVTIPTEDQNGVPTVSVGLEAFKDNEDITSVVIPEGITKLGNACFEGCKNLSEVSLPYSLEDAGRYSTFGSTALTSITVPGNVVRIPSSFFAADSVQLKDFIITPGVQEISSKALWTSGLSELVIPKSVVVMGWGIIMDSAGSNTEPLKVYVLNPEAVIGVVADTDGEFQRIIGGDPANGGPIVRCSQGRRSQIYGVGSDNTAKAHVEKHMASRNGLYFTIDQAKADELEAELKANGVQKPEEKPVEKPAEDTSSTTDSDDKDETSTNKDKDTNKNNTKDEESDSNTVIIVIAVCVVLVVIIIAVAVVLIVVLNNNKKKKKKAKKAAKAAAAAEVESPVEEAPTDTEE